MAIGRFASLVATATGAAQQAVEGRRPHLVATVAVSLSPLVEYHGLGHHHLIPPRFLMRPLLNGGTLGGRQNLMTTRERVHGVLGYYDGVLNGVADFHGQPHAFELHGDLDDEVLTYRLAAISLETMSQFEEFWGIWLRWEQHPPMTSDTTTIPALPQDRSRYALLKPILDGALRVPADSLLLATGEFVQRPDADPQRDGRWALDVEWTLVAPNSQQTVGG